MSKKKWLLVIVLIISAGYAIYKLNYFPIYTNAVNVAYTQILSFIGTDPKTIGLTLASAAASIVGTYRLVQDRANTTISQVQGTADQAMGTMSNSIQVVQNEKTALENKLLSLQEEQKQTVAEFEGLKTEVNQFQTLFNQQKKQITELTAANNALSQQLTTWKLNTYETIVVK
jgi:septal ring factor EnvC (AmiA/AmiB activator)